MATERFDIYDEQDRHLGTATRDEVHERGLWHRTFHCWLVRQGADGRAYVLFQRRSEDKDTNPGRMDITVAGHLAAGETVRDAVREMDEEIGWSAPFEQLAPFGTIREEAEGEAGGRRYIDREVTHVFGCVTDLAPEAYRLQREEVAGLYEADVEALLALMLGERNAVQASGIRLTPDGTPAPDRADVAADDFVARDRGYYLRVFRFLRGLACSESGA